MYIEKYQLMGIKYTDSEVTDILNQSNNNYNSGYNDISISLNLQFIKKEKHHIFFPNHTDFNTRDEAIKYLESNRYIHDDVQFWSILPVLVDVSLEEARLLKIENIQDTM